MNTGVQKLWKRKLLLFISTMFQEAELRYIFHKQKYAIKNIPDQHYGHFPPK